MTSECLKYISDLLLSLNIDYEFGQWSDSSIPEAYFVGEYNEVEGMEKEENGLQETTFIITGTSRKWLLLQQAKEKIENNLLKTAILPNGNGIVIFYGSSIPVPTGDAELKRIQINLQIKEWSVT